MNIIVTGSIAYDYLMQFPGQFSKQIIAEQLHQLSVSFLVEDMTRHWGGVAANIAYNMALLGMCPKLMGTVGRDFPDYRKWLDAIGVDTTTVRQIDDVFTAAFFCNTDQDNNQIAFFYSGAMALAKDYALADIGGDKPDLVVVSPNDPGAMKNLTQECRDKDIRFIYDPSQQIARMDGIDLERDMEGTSALIVNAYESEMIVQKTGQNLADLCKTIEIVVITAGERGSTIYHNGDSIHVNPFPPKTILDPTGGGDAYRAGFIYGMMNRLPLKLAGQLGALSATYTLENVGTQTQRYTPTDFVKRFRTVYNDGNYLDAMLTK